MTITLGTFELQLSVLTNKLLEKYSDLNRDKQYHQLANDLGLSRITICRWKNGSVSYIGDEAKGKLCRYLRCSLGELGLYFENKLSLNALLGQSQSRIEDPIEAILFQLEAFPSSDLLRLMQKIPNLLIFREGGILMNTKKIRLEIRNILNKYLDYPVNEELTLSDVEKLLNYFALYTPRQRIWLLDFLNGQDVQLDYGWASILSAGLIDLTGDNTLTTEWIMSVCH
jgi:DNA-binding Xre family transcriptional regulator